MAIKESLQPTEKSPVQAAAGKTSRLFFIDHLRAALVILVVLHHVAIVYGEGVSFWYVEPADKESLAYLVGLFFVLFNQAWFMGGLFLLAGYFMPGSFDRKGSGSFLKGRLLRLGIPLIIWIFVISPISAIGLFLEPNPRIPVPLTWGSFSQMYPEFIGLGIAWFLALLLIFSFGYAAWRMLRRNRTSSSQNVPSPPSYLGIGIFILGLALVSYLVRIVVPIGRTVLDFPTLAYLPQYLSFFVIGIIAYPRNWFRTIPGSMGVVGFVIALVATIFLFPLAFFGGLSGEFLGYGQWQSAVYTLWDSIFAVGMSLAAITFFRRFFNKDSGFGRFLSQQSYAVYIIHPPIIVFLAFALSGIVLGSFLKFGLLTVIVIPTCFVVAYIIRKIPGVSRVL